VFEDKLESKPKRLLKQEDKELNQDMWMEV